jgi:hypothetical protein
MLTRFRALAASGVLLGGLAAGGSALTATSADAATISTSAACGEVALYFPAGDDLLMTQPSSGLRYAVAAWTISQFTPVGYVESVYEFPGQPVHSGVDAPLNTSYPVEISSFGVTLGYNFGTRQYTPEVVYSTCTWTAQFVPA